MAMLNNQMVYTNEHSIMIFVLPGLTPARPGYPVDFSKKTPRGDVEVSWCDGHSENSHEHGNMVEHPIIYLLQDDII